MTSLYRKYRPQKFSDLVGQETVTTILSQAVAQDKVGHAYLFSGPKGSGKTTSARLLAKALNCLKRKAGEGEPCNKCEQCSAIAEGKSLDVMEIDAASHRGIEEIRELRENVKFAPTKGKKKIYIIDEIHMLTREAFNALLKTLEEPPSHTVFIMATTEPHKVPATIKSRSQHFLFKRASSADLVKRLQKIAKAEEIAIEDDALKLVASTADGSFRDAETTLEQITSSQSGKREMTAKHVQDLLGLADLNLVMDFLSALARGESQAGLKVTAKMHEQGLDVQTFIKHALEMMRQLLLLLAGQEKQVAASLTKDEVESLQELGKLWSAIEAVEVIEKLINASQQVKLSPLPELPLEMMVAQVASNKLQVAGEDQIESKPVTSNPPARPGQPVTTTVPVAKEIDKVDDEIWKSILTEIRNVNTSLYSIMKEALVLGQTADGIALGVRFRFHAEMLSAAKNQTVLTEAVTKVLGRPASITVEVKPEVFTKQEEDLLKMAEELL